MPTIPTSDTADFPTLLLLLDIGGITLRFSELGPLSISDGDDEVLHHGGLSVGAIDEAIDLFGQGAVSRDVQVQVWLPTDDDLDTVIEAIYAGITPTATLYWWTGGDLSEAVPVASGVAVGSIVADPEDPRLYGFTISRDLTDYLSVPDAQNVVRPDCWDDQVTIGRYLDQTQARSRLIVVGKPGYDTLAYGSRIKVCPTILEHVASAVSPEDSLLLLAGHPVVATTVTLATKEGGENGVCDIVQRTDDYGFTGSYADLSTYSGDLTDLLADGEVYAGWEGEAHPGLDGTGFQGLGDVLIWCLQQTSLAADGRIDWLQVSSMRAALNALGRVDTWITERISLLDWLTSEVLPHFPVYLWDGGTGLRVGIWRYDVPATEATLVIDADVPGYRRTTALSASSGDLTNELTVRGYFSESSGNYIRSARWTGGEISATDTDAEYGEVLGHPMLTRSRRLYGLRETSVDAPVIMDRPTLEKTGLYLTYRHALPSVTVGYALPWRKRIPDLGEVASVTDASVRLDGAAGIVTGRRIADGEVEVRVSLLPRA